MWRLDEKFLFERLSGVATSITWHTDEPQNAAAEPAVRPELVKQHGLTPDEFERIKK
jgi:hypothetical protein